MSAYTESKINDEVGTEQRPFTYIEQQVTRRCHHFYISSEIVEPREYTEMIHVIRSSGPDSVIHIHLNTPGGHLDTGVQLINAMQSTEAHVVCSLEGSVASCGTLIFLAGDEFIVHDDSLMMLHNYSGGVFGKGHEQIAALNAQSDWVERIMKRLYIPFLCDEEFERLKAGEDLWFQADDVRVRLEKMVEILKKEKEEEEKQKEEPKPKTTRKRRSNKT